MKAAGRVGDAFGRVRRADFLPPGQRRFAHQDRALPIGNRQSNSQPTTVFAMLELLDVEPGLRVLDVGCGSGWTTALLGDLAGPLGSVCGVELVPELTAWGRQNLAAYEMGWTEITQAVPGRLGLPEGAPYDRILVSAEADALPVELVAQLAVGGVMVIPVAGRMTRVARTEHEPPTRTHHGYYSFVPLL